MERAWDIQPPAGSSIIVAVIDTGIAYQNATITATANRVHGDGGTRYPALGDLTLPFVAATELAPSSRFVAPHDFIWDTNLPLDFDGHGTHVSGTIGQLTNNGKRSAPGGTAGVAFNVKLMPVKVIDGDWDDIFGAPNVATDDVVARGIRYAADNGAKVINMSIGRTGSRRSPGSIRGRDTGPVERGREGRVHRDCRRQRLRGRQRAEVLAEIASRVQGAVSVAAVDRARAHGLLFDHGELYRDRGAGRVRARLRPRRLYLAADLRLQLHRHVTCCRPRTLWRRASTCWPPSATSARRWRRPTCRASPRC